MQIDRLLDIVLLLLNKENITAKELAEKCGVSTRTIYRDIDTLSLSGIPVYSTKGNGGGIGLLQNFTLDKSIVSEKEQKDILFALQSLSAAQFPNIETTLDKISTVFKNVSDTNWIEVDFSHWGSGKEEKEKFNILKEAILTKRVISFDYFNSNRQNTNRMYEPLRLVFKDRAWYIHGFCQLKQDYRVFRISRIRNLTLTDHLFEREMLPELNIDAENTQLNKTISIKLKFDQEVAYRVYDDFNNGIVEYNDDNTFTVTIDYPFDEWVVGYILSFGNSVEVLEPNAIKEIVKQRAEEILKKYK